VLFSALLSDYKKAIFFSFRCPENPFLLFNPILHFAVPFYQTLSFEMLMVFFTKKEEDKYTQMIS